MGADASANIIYTDAQLACIKAGVQTAFGVYIGRYANANLYMLDPCDNLQKSVILRGFYRVISDWQQYSDGSTTGLDNFLTQEEFVTVVEAAKAMANCSC